MNSLITKKNPQAAKDKSEEIYNNDDNNNDNDNNNNNDNTNNNNNNNDNKSNSNNKQVTKEENIALIEDYLKSFARIIVQHQLRYDICEMKRWLGNKKVIGILVYNAIFLQIIINPNMSSFKEKRNQGGGKQNKKQKTENEKERKKRQLFTEANPNWLTKG